MPSSNLYIFVLYSVLQTCVLADLMTHTFTDTQQFIDISTYNFYLGRNTIYENLFTARPGKQVNLYLFQNNVKQYNIHVYDGDSDQAQEISTQGKIPKNDELVEFPDPITSTSGKMYIIVTADNSDLKTRVDFQAMVTDFTQPEACGKLVFSVNQNNNATIMEMLANCYYVLHANDPMNNQFLAQNIQNGLNLNPDDYILYKGLKTDDAHKLVNDRTMSYIQATDKYLVFKTTAVVAFSHYWYYAAGYVITTGVGYGTRAPLMTVDYLLDEYPLFVGGFEQDFLIRRYSPVLSIQITYLSLLGTGSLTVTPYMGNIPTEPAKTYLAANFKGGSFNVTYEKCDQIQLKYSTPVRTTGTDSGFYGIFRDATNNQILSSTTDGTLKTTSNNLVISTTTKGTDEKTTTYQATPTKQPVQSTTKTAGRVCNLFTIISLTTLLFI